jgi:ABC-type multidrug transport system ATPase subunit
VTIDGRDIRDVKLASLRRNVGVIFQEPLLFNRSIADNLRVGNPDATNEDIREACRRAQALDFIERNAEGLDAMVGERGRMLSGGERQRLSIARALLKNPPILILDEATSALDAATEAKVNAALNEVMQGRTSFVIAHRLATVRNADRILVFDQGHIVESGTFDDLVRKGGILAELAKVQFIADAQVQPDRHGSARARLPSFRRGEDRLDCSFSPAGEPGLEPVEIEIDDRRGVERQDLAEREPSDHGIAERLAELGARAMAKHQRYAAEERGHGGHQDRPEAEQAGLADRGQRGMPVALAVNGKVDQHDAVLLDDAD